MNPAPPVTNIFMVYSSQQILDRGPTLLSLVSHPLSFFLHPHEPVPAMTTQPVRSKILKSSHSDQCSIYSRSIFTQSSKWLIWLRPRTCHKQVMPGLMLSLRLCQNSYRSSS